MTYALFHHERQISKPHSTKVAAVIEAFERKAVIRCGRVYEMAEGYSVGPVSKGAEANLQEKCSVQKVSA